MARFAYNGERPPHTNFIKVQGPCTQIKIPLQNGSIQVITAADQVHGFAIGADIGVDITDARAIRVLTADDRFTRLS
jgi:hypothetical protein